MNDIINELYNKAIKNDILSMVLNNNDKIIIDGMINNKSIKILVDTGATNTYITKKTIELLEIKNKIDKTECRILKGIGKTKTLGVIWYEEIIINDNIYPTLLHVIDNIESMNEINIILGLNFLYKYNINIDMNNNMMIIDKNFIKF